MLAVLGASERIWTSRGIFNTYTSRVIDPAWFCKRIIDAQHSKSHTPRAHTHSDVSALACQHRSISDAKSDPLLMGLNGVFGRKLMVAEACLTRNTGPGEAHPSVFFSFRKLRQADNTTNRAYRNGTTFKCGDGTTNVITRVDFWSLGLFIVDRFFASEMYRC